MSLTSGTKNVKGARTSISEAKRMKASGYKRGFPDVFIYEPRGGFHGLSIEMKKEKGGVVSKHQKQWKESLIVLLLDAYPV